MYTPRRATVLSQRFTLVELLVVIGIIAVLSGMLLGAVAHARHYSRTVACGQGLKQSGTALLDLLMTSDRDEFEFSTGGQWQMGCCGLTWVPGGGSFVMPVKLEGCPMAPDNALYAVDPENEPKKQSYGIMDFGRLERDVDGKKWFLACSDNRVILNIWDFAYKRHDAGVNLFYFDGHVDSKPYNKIELWRFQ